MHLGARESMFVVAVVAVGLWVAWLVWPAGPSLSKLEMTELGARVNTALRPGPAVSCARPVLRGVARDGSATDLMYDLVRDDGPASACLLHLAQHASALKQALIGPGSGPFATSPEGIEQQEPAELAAVRTACAGMSDRVRQAVAYERACSPLAVGGPLLADGIQSQTYHPQLAVLALAISADAQHLVRSGDALAASELLLDGIRFADDLARGRVTILDEAVSSGMIEQLFGQLSPIALDPHRMTADERAVVRDQLATLIKSREAPSTLGAGEEAVVMGYLLYRQENSQGDERLAALADLLALDFMARAGARACTADDSYAACADGWDSLTSRIRDGDRPVSLLAVESDAMRKLAEDSIQSIVATSRADVIRRAGATHAALVGLELALRSTGAVPARCPAAAEVDPGLGVALDVAESPRRRVAVSAPEALGAPVKNALVTFECPEPVAPAVEVAPGN